MFIDPIRNVTFENKNCYFILCFSLFSASLICILLWKYYMYYAIGHFSNENVFSIKIWSRCFVFFQVLTRMLFSSSPILYWFAAYCTSDETKTQVTIRNEYDVIRPREDIYKVEKEENLEHSLKNILTDQIINFSKQSFVSKLILCHFLFYFTVGTFMFCNFLPWT